MDDSHGDKKRKREAEGWDQENKKEKKEKDSLPVIGTASLAALQAIPSGVPAPGYNGGRSSQRQYSASNAKQAASLFLAFDYKEKHLSGETSNLLDYGFLRQGLTEAEYQELQAKTDREKIERRKEKQRERQRKYRAMIKLKREQEIQGVFDDEDEAVATINQLQSARATRAAAAASRPPQTQTQLVSKFRIPVAKQAGHHSSGSDSTPAHNAQPQSGGSVTPTPAIPVPVAVLVQPPQVNIPSSNTTNTTNTNIHIKANTNMDAATNANTTTTTTTTTTTSPTNITSSLKTPSSTIRSPLPLPSNFPTLFLTPTSLSSPILATPELPEPPSDDSEFLTTRGSTTLPPLSSILQNIFPS